MRWTHAALRTHYRGWISGTTADHNYNWHDSIHARITNADGGRLAAANSCGYNLVAPCDDQGHGTHTTGHDRRRRRRRGRWTGTNQIGVAPGAKWIGCRNMDAGQRPRRHLHRVLPVLPGADRSPRAKRDPTKRPHVDEQ